MSRYHNDRCSTRASLNKYVKSIGCFVDLTQLDLMLDWLSPGETTHDHWRRSKTSFKNASRVEHLPANTSPNSGRHVPRLHCDEIELIRL